MEAEAVPRGNAVPVSLPVPVRVAHTEPETLGEPESVREVVVEGVPKPLPRGEAEAMLDVQTVGDEGSVAAGDMDGGGGRLALDVVVAASKEGEGAMLVEMLPLGEGERSGEALTEGERSALVEPTGEHEVLDEVEARGNTVAPPESDAATLADAGLEGKGAGERDSITLRVGDGVAGTVREPTGEWDAEGLPEGDLVGCALLLLLRLSAPPGERVEL